MELYQLRSFVTVAREGNVRRAAERLFTSQPAVSAHLKALEGELGVRLFARTPKGMELTHAGAGLLARAEQVLEGARLLSQEALGYKNVLSGRVRFGINGDPDRLRLSTILGLVSESHPALEVQVIDAITGHALRMLDQDALDVAYVEGHVDESRYRFHRLGEFDMMLVAPSSWHERIADADWPALGAMNWVRTREDCAYHDMTARLWREKGIEPRTPVTADGENTLMALVAGGMGLSLMRSDMAREGERRGDFAVYPHYRSRTWLGLACLRSREDDPVIHATVACARASWGQATRQ